MIPLKKMKRVNQIEHINNPSKKYIQVVTVDDFDFWFMGFLNYEKAFKFLQKKVSRDWEDWSERLQGSAIQEKVMNIVKILLGTGI